MGLVKQAYWAFRSLIFYSGFVAIVAVMSTLACLLFFVPFRPRQRIATFGNHLVTVWLAFSCNIKITVSGTENIPEGPCVILSNHQSTWETFYLQWYFQPASVILKHSLMWVPLFGWGLALMQPIAIKRSQPAKAIRYVLKQGMRRIAGGNRIIIYPEGTRVTPEQLGPFKTSGAALAKKAGVAILPVAHNAGEHWAPDSFIKRPGTILMQIGPAIDSQTGDPRQLTDQARDWIQGAL